MKTLKPNHNIISKTNTKFLVFILTTLCVVIAVLTTFLVIRIASVNQQSEITGENNRILGIADPELIEPRLNEQYFFPIGIASSWNDLTEITEKYSLKSSEMQKYKTEFYDSFNNNFAASNYLAIGYVNEWCGTRTFGYNGQENLGEQVKVQLVYRTGSGPCTVSGEVLFIEIPKNIVSLEQISYGVVREGRNNNNHNLEVLKPIIYLYPEEETELDVALGAPDLLTVTYPKYQDGWHVVAYPDGTLKDLTTGRELYSLYWEGVRNDEPDLSSGFVVKGEDSASFLEEKLDYLGLNPKEAEEFIVYWLPKLESSPYNIIKFEDSDTIEHNMPLKISQNGRPVTPDTLIRIRMAFHSIEQPINISEQQLVPSPHRHGFTVVEWGGTEV